MQAKLQLDRNFEYFNLYNLNVHLKVKLKTGTIRAKPEKMKLQIMYAFIVY